MRGHDRLAADPAALRHRPGELLREHGIPVRHDLPGVGGNLQDHLQIRAVYKVKDTLTLNERARGMFGKRRHGLEYALFRRGPMTVAPSQLGGFARSDPSFDTPNLEYHVQPLSLDKFGEPLHPFPAFTASVCNLRPTSRGYVRIRSPEPSTHPAIQPNYLSTDEDRRVAADAIRLTRRIAAAKALQRFQPEEYRPGAGTPERRGVGEGGGRHRHDDLPPGRHLQDGTCRGRARRGRSAAAGAWAGGPAHRRRLDHADDHLGQHRGTHRHDRRKGGRPDPRRKRPGTCRVMEARRLKRGDTTWLNALQAANHSNMPKGPLTIPLRPDGACPSGRSSGLV